MNASCGSDRISDLSLLVFFGEEGREGGEEEMSARFVTAKVSAAALEVSSRQFF